MDLKQLTLDSAPTTELAYSFEMETVVSQCNPTSRVSSVATIMLLNNKSSEQTASCTQDVLKKS